MILVLLGICIIVVVVSVLLVTYDICDDEICFCSIVVFGIGFLICIGALFYFLHSVIDAKFVKDKIAMYEEQYNVPLVKTQMKKIIVTAKTLYSHPKNVSKIYAALHTDLAW